MLKPYIVVGTFSCGLYSISYLFMNIFCAAPNILFSCGREGCCYDCSLFTQYGVDILEDLVITLADAIASLYLELISVDGNMSNEINSICLMMCTLSTRELQKLRNEVC